MQSSSTEFLLEDLQLDGLGIYQQEGSFKFGSDAVHLTNFVKPTRGVALDIGSGTGILPILLIGKRKASFVYGVEIDKSMADMSNCSVQYNNLCDKITILNCKIQEIDNFLDAGSCSVVTANPPYNKAGSGKTSDIINIANSRFENSLTLQETIKAAQYLLSTGGKFYLIHQIDRMAEIMYECITHKLQPKLVKFLDSKRFLCQCAKDGKVGLRIANQ